VKRQAENHTCPGGLPTLFFFVPVVRGSKAGTSWYAPRWRWGEIGLAVGETLLDGDVGQKSSRILVYREMSKSNCREPGEQERRAASSLGTVDERNCDRWRDCFGAVLGVFDRVSDTQELDETAHVRGRVVEWPWAPRRER
jgi:hypothetical protein